MGRVLILIGLLIAAVGALIHFGVPIGRLPGDITIRRDNFTFSFPIVTCIVISIVLTVLLRIFRK